MSENTTLARPYARATFEFALETSAENALSAWSHLLHMLSGIVQNHDAECFLSDPSVRHEFQVELILSVLRSINSDMVDPTVVSWLEILCQNKRLLLIPAIAEYFDKLRAEHEKTLTVSVVSFGPLSEAQQEILKQQLSKRLQRQVKLSISLDPLLLGGAIICAGDWVLDSTVKCKLTQLGSLLAA